MHFGDPILLFVIALILFGPKKLPEMARQFAKLMAEFRRASNEFKTQIDEELRSAEEAERQKQISAAKAATILPVSTSDQATATMTAELATPEPTILPPSTGVVVSHHAYSDPSWSAPASLPEPQPEVRAESGSTAGTAAGWSEIRSPFPASDASPGTPPASTFSDVPPPAPRSRYGELFSNELSFSASQTVMPLGQTVQGTGQPKSGPTPNGHGVAMQDPVELPISDLPVAELPIEGTAAENAQASIHHV